MQYTHLTYVGSNQLEARTKEYEGLCPECKRLRWDWSVPVDVEVNRIPKESEFLIYVAPLWLGVIRRSILARIDAELTRDLNLGKVTFSGKEIPDYCSFVSERRAVIRGKKDPKSGFRICGTCGFVIHSPYGQRPWYVMKNQVDGGCYLSQYSDLLLPADAVTAAGIQRSKFVALDNTAVVDNPSDGLWFPGDSKKSP